MVVRPLAFLAALTIPAASVANENGPTICDIVAHPERFRGDAIQMDAVFASDAIHHTYILTNGCNEQYAYDVDIDHTGLRGGPALLWELVNARRHSTSTKWYGVSARATVRINVQPSSPRRTILAVEDIYQPSLAPIPSPPLPPPLPPPPAKIDFIGQFE